MFRTRPLKSRLSVFQRSALAAFALTTATTAAPTSPTPIAPEPFLRLRDTAVDYHGTSDDLTGLKEIRIGWFGPADAADPVHGDAWWAANLAVQEENERHAGVADNTFATLPVRLVPRWSADPWGSGVAQLARMVFDEQPLALLGSIDSASTHLAEQVVAKANVPLVSPIATDKTATLAGVSWMFSCAPDDTAIARAIVDGVAAAIVAPVAALERSDNVVPSPLNSQPSEPQGRLRDSSRAASRQQQEALDSQLSSPALLLLSTTDHESRMAAREVVRALAGRGLQPSFRLELPTGVTEAAKMLHAVAAVHPAAVIVIANVEDSARLTRTVRAQLGAVPVFGGSAMGRVRFRELAGPAADGVHFPLLFAPPADETAARFTARFFAERHHAPDFTAALTYDSTRLLIAAIRQAGPNRARVRTALAALSPWAGIAGPIDFDGTGQNRRAALPLGTVHAGAIAVEAPLPAADAAASP